MDMGESGTYTMFKRSADVDVAGAYQSSEGQGPPHWLVYVGCDDVDATASRAAELGGTALLEPTDVPGVGRLAVLQDPQGAVFGIFNPTSQ